MEDRDYRRSVALVEIHEKLHRPDLMPEVEVDRRFVEDENRCGLGNREGDEGELSLAERKLADVPAEQVADSDPFDGGRDRRSVSGPRTAHRVLVRQATEANELFDPNRERDDHLLRHDRDETGQLRAFEPVKRLSSDPRLAVIRGHEAGRDAKERGLAGPVRADQGDPFAPLDRDVDPGQHGPMAIRHRDVPQLDHSS